MTSSHNSNSDKTKKDDLLDQVAIRMNKNYVEKNLEVDDFKKYDYPSYDFD